MAKSLLLATAHAHEKTTNWPIGFGAEIRRVLETAAMQDGAVDTKFARSAPHRQVHRPDDFRIRQCSPWAPQAPPGRAYPRKARPHPLCDSCPLELRNRAEDVHLQPPRRRGRVDPLGKADEGDAHRLQLIEQRNQVFQVAPKPIEAPTQEHIELAALGVLQKNITQLLHRSFLAHVRARRCCVIRGLVRDRCDEAVSDMAGVNDAPP